MSGALHRTPQGASSRVVVTPEGTRWRFLSFEAFRLTAGAVERRSSDGNELALVVLGGRVTLSVDDGGPRFEQVGGRADVWSATPASTLLLGPRQSVEIQALTDAHLAIAAAASDRTSAPRLIDPLTVRVEERGEGQTFRRVHHLLPPSADAQRLILFEVYTPGGNWSSFPPHKHDTHDPPRECVLEEIYYYAVRPAGGFALQRVYTSDRVLDESVAAGDGDLVLVPRGYHVVSASPGHDCYYLNAMAGPERVWAFTVDSAYAHLMNWTAPT